MIFGVDFGARYSGKTALARNEEDVIIIESVPAGECADSFLTDAIQKHLPALVAIDAPLSLPSAYYGRGNDFHYRACDRDLNAMSPMFLGGLTARAVALKKRLEETVPFIEVYPAVWSRGAAGNKSMDQDLWNKLKNRLPLMSDRDPASRHELDALIAWWTGWLYMKGDCSSSGHVEEGLIYYPK